MVKLVGVKLHNVEIQEVRLQVPLPITSHVDPMVVGKFDNLQEYK